MSKFKNALRNTTTIFKLLKKFDFEGTSFPGKMLLKFYPNFLSDAQNYALGSKFAVTGTNGKTTTSGILAKILKEAGKSIVHNDNGANMPAGITTSVALGLFNELKGGDLTKRIDNFVIECDEAYLENICKKIIFEYLLITNLFGDQMDRHGHIDAIKEKIRSGISQNGSTKLILNADDPELYDIEGEDDEAIAVKKREKVFFGIEKVDFIGYEKTSADLNEVIYCPKCKAPIEYENRYYSQLGKWYCASCGCHRSVPEINARVKMFAKHCFLYIEYQRKEYTFKVNMTGLYNAYNALAAISCALLDGVERRFIDKALENYQPAFGREYSLTLNNKDVVVYLIKNPVGASEVLRGLKDLSKTRLLISVNDKHADGRDISWLWDTNFESLSDFDGKIHVTGSRADDMALRLKYAGCDTGSMVIDNDIKRSLKDAIDGMRKSEALIILTTYTSLLKMKKLFKEYQ